MSRPTILVVEDETITAMALRASLESMGYAVPATVPTGAEAIERARVLRPDAVLMDIRLKGQMDGISAAEVIRREVGSPVIYLTAYSDPETLRRARVTEPYGYIVKPYNEAELRAAVEIAVHKGAMERARRADSETLGGDVFQRIIDVNPGAIYLKRSDGRLLFVNARFEALFGVVREGARDVADAAFLPQVLSEGDTRALEGNAVTQSRESIALPKGEREFHVMRMPLQRGDGSVYGLCTILTDAAQPADALGRLGSELQRSTGEALVERPADALAASHDALSSEARNLASSVRALVGKLLAPTRSKPGPHQQDVDLTLLANDVVQRLTEKEPRAARVQIVIEPGMSAQADPLLLGVIMECLLRHAISVSEMRDRPRVEVGRRVVAAGERVFFVHDNGLGFEGATAEQLFQPFAKPLDPSAPVDEGLDLSAVKSYVEAHGGRVWAESIDDGGETIFFSLPDAPAQETGGPQMPRNGRAR